ASGEAYRAVAQESKQAASTSSAVGQSATDDLETLRLEIEALRKSLQATRERVKKLENKEQPHRGRQKIVVTSPQAKDVIVTQQYVCQIHAQRHINVRALVDGYLKDVLVKEGQAVKQGEVMFEILPTLYQAKYDAEVAEVRLAQIELDNIKKLNAQKVVSIQD